MRNHSVMCTCLSGFHVSSLLLFLHFWLCVFTHIVCIHLWGHFRCVVCVTAGYDVFTSVSTRVHIVCTAYGWVWSCSTHTAHNTLIALTSAHLWCVSKEVTFLVRMSCAGKVHTPMSVWSPHHMDVPHNTHLCVHTAHSCAQYV